MLRVFFAAIWLPTGCAKLEAQATPEASATAVPAAQASTAEAPDILVTAERGSQKPAGAETALSEHELSQQGINSLRDLTAATPYAEVGSLDGNTEIYMRGVGSNYNSELGDPAVATHIDGVYLPRARGLGAMFFDIERVEMGRGPQGALRGRNATAGVIDIITHKPVLGEWQGESSLQLGNYAQRLGRGMVNIPIGERAALRLAGFFENRSPFYENAGPVKTIVPAENADVLAYRASALWQPMAAVKINLQHDYTLEGGTGFSGSNYQNALSAGLLPNEIPNPRAVIYRGPQAKIDMKHWGVSGNLNLDMRWATLSYLGSYRSLKYTSITGNSAGVAFPGMRAPELDDWSTSYARTTSRSIVQQLQLRAPDHRRLRWTVGGIAFIEDQTAFLGTTADRSNGFAGVEYNMPDIPGRSYAAFADMTYDILEALHVIGGIRVTAESKARNGIGNVYGFAGLTDNFRFGTEGFAFKGQNRGDFSVSSGVPQPPFTTFRNGIARFGVRDSLDEQLSQPEVVMWPNSQNEQHGRYAETYLDFHMGSDVAITKNNLVYAMMSTGHKAGGFNDSFRTMDGAVIAPSYKAEVVYSTEVGSRNRFLNDTLSANFSAFWYAYRDQQLDTVQQVADGGQSGGTVAVAVRSNAASSRVLGLEGELSGQLPLGLQLTFSGMLLDARFESGSVRDARAESNPMKQPLVDMRGKFLPRAPVVSVNYGLRQNISTAIGVFDWAINAQTKSKQYMTVFNGDGRDTLGNIQPNLSDEVLGYTRIDVSFGYTRPDGRSSFDGFVTNLTDVTYATTLLSTPGMNVRFFNPPRQLGVRMTLRL